LFLSDNAGEENEEVFGFLMSIFMEILLLLLLFPAIVASSD